ncbi:MAG: DUF4097 family beta strand repeat-containing protein [Thermoanaerobaculia bacterium]
MRTLRRARLRGIGIALAVVTTAATLSAETLTENFDQSYPVKPGAHLVLSNENGSIHLSSWERPSVRIRAEKVIKAHGDAARDAMKELKIEVTPKDGGLVVETRRPHGSGGGFLDWLSGSNVDYEVRYEVTVPSSFDVQVETVNGRVEAKDLSGELKFETTNGSIEVANLAGSVSAQTTNGSIHAELRQISGAKPMRFHTTNGRIHVALPEGYRGEVDAGTTNGAISTDFPITSTNFSRTRLEGTINGGGPLLELKTTNGGITIAKR